METTRHRILIKTTSIFLILLTSASLCQAYPPDNAAVLYYKSFLMLKEPSKEVKEMMADMRHGKIKATDQIRQCLDENRYALEFVEAAADVRECDWGHDISRGLGVLMPELSKLRVTAFMLTAKAQILAEEGDYRAALARCLTIHKMARHAGDSLLISYLVSTALHSLANERIEDFLSSMPQDTETLTWLKGQLVTVSVNAPLIKRAMAREKEISMHEIRKERIDSILETMGDDFAKDEVTAEAFKKVRKADPEFFRDNREYYADVMDDIIVALDLPYEKSHRKLKELSARIERDARENPAAIMAALLTPANSRVRTLGIRSETVFNATRAAIEIYIIRAETGQLPQKLPADLPRDLFSGKDFEYEKTKDGFTLRCRAKDLDKDEIYEYEFKTR